MLHVLEVLFVLVPPVCWFLLMRTRPVGAVVGVLLLVLAGAVVGARLGWAPVRAEVELYLAYGPVGAALIAAGALVERRMLGPRKDTPGRERAHGAVGALSTYLVAVLGLAAPAYWLTVLHTEFVPPRRALPVPAGLTVTEGSDTGCTNNSCGRSLIVRGPDGMAGAEVARRLRAALAEDGWRPVAASPAVMTRPNGWILDTRPLRVHLVERPQALDVSVDGLAFEPDLP
ncbi:hypothetical protein ACWGB8_32620 [Kitasatospora sp. NPDC054939]